ncbi:hypothetical protein K0T92_16275 [Paenibacillus oenotherae]|uniref:Uncharacterized protein n=1 Tax=Paenibacillus oenotherae TaxID=1435645 RepID=A0ABS7D8T9_9BACL|nr:hypothetical protein [Paenibacillus oenotherae]MBW7476290.1 hypothetical protein [Paenibacillus oenotherae]
MYPVKIRLFGIRDIDTVELDLGEKKDMLLFGGVNGTGKSTLSFAIAYALGSDQISSETLRSKVIDTTKVHWNAIVEVIFHNPFELREIDAPEWISLGVSISQKPNQQAYPQYFAKHGDLISELIFFRKYRSREEAREDYELKYGISPDKFFMFWFQNTITRFATMRDRERFEYVAEMYGLRETQESWERAKIGRQEAQEDFERAKMQLDKEKIRVNLAERNFNYWRQWNKLRKEGVFLRRQYWIENQRWISYNYKKISEQLDQQNNEISTIQMEYKSLDHQKADVKHSIELENKKMEELNERKRSKKNDRDGLNYELEKNRNEFNKLDEETKEIQEKYKGIRPLIELTVEKEEVANKIEQSKSHLKELETELVEIKEKQNHLLQKIGGLKENKKRHEEQIDDWEEYFANEESIDLLLQIESKARDDYFKNKRELEQYTAKYIELKRDFEQINETKAVSHPLQDQSIRFFKDKGYDVYRFGELFEINKLAASEEAEFLLDGIKYAVFVDGPIETVPNQLLHVSLTELKITMQNVEMFSLKFNNINELLDWKPDLHLSADNKSVIRCWLNLINSDDSSTQLVNSAIISNGAVKEILGWRGALSTGAAIGRDAWIQRCNWLTFEISECESKISNLSSLEIITNKNWKDLEKRRELHEDRHVKLPHLQRELRDLNDEINKLEESHNDYVINIMDFEKEKLEIQEGLIHLDISKNSINNELLIHEQFSHLSEKIKRIHELADEISGKAVLRDKLTYEINDIEESIEGCTRRNRQAIEENQSIERQQNGLRITILEINNKIEVIRREANSIKEKEFEDQSLFKEFENEYSSILDTLMPYEYQDFETISESRLKDWDDSARRKLNDAESMIIDELAEEKYNAVLVSYNNAEKETLTAEAIFMKMQKQEEQLRDLFKKMVYDRYQRVNQHFQNYIQRIGFRGKIEQIEPDDSDPRRKYYEWRLHIATKPGHDMEYLRPTEGLRQKIVSGPSGGEMAVISLMFALALLTDIEKRPPFYMLDEFDSALDEWRKGIVIDLYTEILKRKLMIISPKSHASDYLSRFSLFYAFVSDHKEGKRPVSKILRLERESYKKISSDFEK